MEKVKVYQPQYYKKFRCTGSECRDNCCSGWGIMIDKDAYERFMSLDADNRSEFEKKTEPTGEEAFPARHKLDENGNCEFLAAGGLCGIQLKYGHEFLCRTCRMYPRRFCDVAGETEMFLELSCEAACKLVLFEQNIMKFDTALMDGGTILQYNCLKPEKYAPGGDAVSVFWKLRTTSIMIVQSRHLRFRIRMLILGIFIKQSSELLSAGNYSELLELADTFRERMDTDYYDEVSKRAPGGAELDFHFINDMLGKFEPVGRRSLRKSIEMAREGLGVTPEGEIPETLGDSFLKYYELYFSDKEYIFENYVMSHIFTDGFPFNFNYEDNIMKNYKELLIKYSVIKFLLVGVSCRYMKYDKRRVVECVSSFSRIYDHIRDGVLIIK